jgi:D-aspartate ligase
VGSRADLDAVPDEIFNDAIIKPRDSQSFIARFGVKAYRVRSRREAAERLGILTAQGIAVILQEYIPGPPTDHFFVDGFVDRFGTMQGVFVRQRLRMHPFDFGNSTYMVSVDRDAAADAIASSTKLLAHAGYRGMFSAEFKRDQRDGRFKILEVNARAWWYVDFAARCGVDVCRMAYQDALELPVKPVRDYAVGRTLVFPYADHMACRALWDRGELSTLGWVRSWLTSTQPVFQLSDPLPAAVQTATMLGGYVRRRVGRMVTQT